MTKLNSNFICSLIENREKKSHKGNYGHVLIVAGSKGMSGAAVLTANAAVRCGAGLVTLAVPASQQPIVASKIRPEVMTLPLPDKKAGTLNFKAKEKIIDFIDNRKVNTVVIGPGLGKSSEILSIIKKLILLNINIVLDADGLNSISNQADVLSCAAANVIITPHVGELSRLIKVPREKIASDRAKYAKNIASKYKIVCVLKGFETVITDGVCNYANTTGNPGMATGGSGDVLSGMIGALINQVKKCSIFYASLCGVYIHGLAGDIAARDKTETGLLAGDISEYIPAALKKTGLR